MEGKDFYFELSRKESSIIGDFFLITPVAYYDKEGCLSDESGVADEVVPKGFYELAESTYEFQGTSELGRELLLNLGMKEIKFGLQLGESSNKSSEEDEEFEIDPEDDLDTLLQGDEPNAFDYKNVSTDKLIRHLKMMLTTESFEEAAKIKDELNSRGVESF